MPCFMAGCLQTDGVLFPKDEASRLIWLDGLKMKDRLPETESFICYDHLKEAGLHLKDVIEENADDLCRACMRSTNLVNTIDDLLEDYVSIASVLTLCAYPLEICSQKDEFPKKICQDCLDIVKTMQAFRKQLLVSHQAITERFQCPMATTKRKTESHSQDEREAKKFKLKETPRSIKNSEEVESKEVETVEYEEVFKQDSKKYDSTILDNTDNTKYVNTEHGNTEHHNAQQHNTEYNNTEHDNTEHDNTEHDNTEHSNTEHDNIENDYTRLDSSVQNYSKPDIIQTAIESNKAQTHIAHSGVAHTVDCRSHDRNTPPPLLLLTNKSTIKVGQIMAKIVPKLPKELNVFAKNTSQVNTQETSLAHTTQSHMTQAAQAHITQVHTTQTHIFQTDKDKGCTPQTSKIITQKTIGPITSPLKSTELKTTRNKYLNTEEIVTIKQERLPKKTYAKQLRQTKMKVVKEISVNDFNPKKLNLKAMKTPNKNDSKELNKKVTTEINKKLINEFNKKVMNEVDLILPDFIKIKPAEIYESEQGWFSCHIREGIYESKFVEADDYLFIFGLLKNRERHIQCIVPNCEACGEQNLLEDGAYQGQVYVRVAHNHPPPTEQIKKKQIFFHVMRKKMQNDKTLNIRNVYEEICQEDAELRSLIPLRNVINEICRHQYSYKIPTIKSFDHLFDVIESDVFERLHFTHSGQQFYQERFAADDGGLALVFCNTDVLDQVSESSIMYVDASFKIDTDEDFKYQLITVLVWLDDSYYPILFAILNRKTQDIFKKVFAHLRDVLAPNLKPQQIITDYEACLYYALGETYLESHIGGSVFYYTQNIYKKICSLNLSKDLETNSYFRNIYHMLLMLPLLPVNTILDGLNNIEIQARDMGLQELSRPVFDHVRTQWILNVTPELFCVHRLENRINENVIAPFKKLRDYLLLTKGKMQKTQFSIVHVIAKLIELESFLSGMYSKPDKKSFGRDLSTSQKKSVLRAWQFIETHPKININGFFSKVLGYIKCMENQLWIWGFYRYAGDTDDVLINASNFSIINTEECQAGSYENEGCEYGNFRECEEGNFEEGQEGNFDECQKGQGEECEEGNLQEYEEENLQECQENLKECQERNLEGCERRTLQTHGEGHLPISQLNVRHLDVRHPHVRHSEVSHLKICEINNFEVKHFEKCAANNLQGETNYLEEQEGTHLDEHQVTELNEPEEARLVKECNLEERDGNGSQRNIIDNSHLKNVIKNLCVVNAPTEITQVEIHDGEVTQEEVMEQGRVIVEAVIDKNGSVLLQSQEGEAVVHVQEVAVDDQKGQQKFETTFFKYVYD